MDKTTWAIVISIIIAAILISTSVFLSDRNLELRSASEIQRQLRGEPPEEEVLEDSIVLEGDDPYQGDKTVAEIAIIEFSDFDCPFCARFNADGRAGIKENYVDSGKAILVWKDWPLPSYRPNNIKQAQAAHCIWDQQSNEGFFEFKAGLYAKKDNGEKINEAKIFEVASTLEGINIELLKECLDSEAKSEKVESNQKLGSSLGITGTPGIIIGKWEGEKIVDPIRTAGALPYKNFEQIIDDYLEK